MNEWGPRIKSYPPSVFFSPLLSFSCLPLRARRLPFPRREWNRVGVIKSTYPLPIPSLSIFVQASFDSPNQSLSLSTCARMRGREGCKVLRRHRSFGQFNSLPYDLSSVSKNERSKLRITHNAICNFDMYLSNFILLSPR